MEDVKKKKTERKEVELTEERAVWFIPNNAVSLTVDAKVLIDDSALWVSREIGTIDLIKTIADTENNYFGDEEPETEDGKLLHAAMVWIPKETLAIKLRAKLTDLTDWTETFGFDDVREAVNRGKNYIADDDRFVLTEKGRHALGGDI